MSFRLAGPKAHGKKRGITQITPPPTAPRGPGRASSTVTPVAPPPPAPPPPPPPTTYDGGGNLPAAPPATTEAVVTANPAAAVQAAISAGQAIAAGGYPSNFSSTVNIPSTANPMRENQGGSSYGGTYEEEDRSLGKTVALAAGAALALWLGYKLLGKKKR